MGGDENSVVRAILGSARPAELEPRAEASFNETREDVPESRGRTKIARECETRRFAATSEARKGAWLRAIRHGNQTGDLPRNEGVPGSSPGVGLKIPAQRLLLGDPEHFHIYRMESWLVSDAGCLAHLQGFLAS
jgi:hypothetical protein